MHPLNQHDLIQKYIAGNHFGALLGINFEILEKGKVIYHSTIEDKHLATPFAAHGGLLATLCDGALGIAALSQVAEIGKIVSTIEMNIKYLKPVLLGDQLIAKAEIIQAGNRLIFSEAKVYNQKKELVVSASGTFNAYPKEKAGY